jgi:hypothetical protein
MLWQPTQEVRKYVKGTVDIKGDLEVRCARERIAIDSDCLQIAEEAFVTNIAGGRNISAEGKDQDWPPYVLERPHYCANSPEEEEH